MKKNEYENPARSANIQNQNPGPQEEGMKIDGLQQVIELLKHADPSFRESLLKRLGGRDPKLAQSLRKIIR